MEISKEEIQTFMNKCELECEIKRRDSKYTHVKLRRGRRIIAASTMLRAGTGGANAWAAREVKRYLAAEQDDRRG